MDATPRIGAVLLLLLAVSKSDLYPRVEHTVQIAFASSYTDDSLKLFWASQEQSSWRYGLHLLLVSCPQFRIVVASLFPSVLLCSQLYAIIFAEDKSTRKSCTPTCLRLVLHADVTLTCTYRSWCLL